MWGSDSQHLGSIPSISTMFLGITQLVEWRIVVVCSLLNDDETPHVAGSIPAPEIVFKIP